MVYLKNDRLALRAVEPEDAELMWEIENDSSQWSDCGIYAPLSHRNLKEYAVGYEADPFRAGQLRLIIENQGKVCGIADLYDISVINRTAFVGIYIHPDCRCRGIGSEAIQLLEQYSYQILNLRILAAKIISGNKTSADIFSKSGYRKCGTLNGWILSGGSIRDLDIYTKSLQ